MRLQVSDVISFGAFATTVFIALKARRKSFIGLFILIGVSALAVSIFSRSEKTVPTAKQVAIASGGSAINQAEHDLTIIQNPKSEELLNAVREAVAQKAVAGMAEFSKRYPHGFLIFGLAENGEPIVYLPRLKNVQ
jgi:hypothetical protein